MAVEPGREIPSQAVEEPFPVSRDGEIGPEARPVGRADDLGQSAVGEGEVGGVGEWELLCYQEKKLRG